MIWFSCGQCKKVHGRPENASGSMIFCACGQGVVVPWESTAPAPVLSTSAPSVPPPPRVEPLSFGFPLRAEPADSLPPPRASRRASRRQQDPNRCFNHEERPKQKECEECGLPFCEECVVIFRGQTVCGPCKNYEAKLLQRPPRLSGMSLSSVFIAFGSGLLILCLSPWSHSRVFLVMAGIALFLQTAALFLGLWAMRKMQKDPRLGGQGLAMSGIAAAAMTAMLTLAVTVYTHRPGSG